MLKDILNAFKTPEPSTLRTEDARIAMAALLVRIARSDEVYDENEKDLINKMLQSRYKLIDNQSEDIRKQAEELEAKAPDTVRFTRLIKDTVPFEDRKSVVKDLWSVVLSDGKRDAEENNSMRLIANLLGVNDKDSALARQSVERNNIA
ncbi:MAG: TerB family tellurite resistance protein [Amylibacter sp.]